MGVLAALGGFKGGGVGGADRSIVVQLVLWFHMGRCLGGRNEGLVL